MESSQSSEQVLIETEELETLLKKGDAPLKILNVQVNFGPDDEDALMQFYKSHIPT